MINSVRSDYIDKLRERVFKFVEEHEQEVSKRIQPRPPRVLVFVLPKDFRSAGGLIVIPDVAKTHKPTYEGIVIRTYRPYWRQLRYNTTRYILGQGNVECTEEVKIEPRVAVGDHVLFPHFEGIPVPFMDYDMHHFRLVAEDVLVGALDYEKKTGDALAEFIDQGLRSETSLELSKRLQEKFLIVPRDQWSLTSSGVGEYSGS